MRKQAKARGGRNCGGRSGDDVLDSVGRVHDSTEPLSARALPGFLFEYGTCQRERRVTAQDQIYVPGLNEAANTLMNMIGWAIAY